MSFHPSVSLQCQHQISTINDHLYLSGSYPVTEANLHRKEITCVIDASNMWCLNRNGVDYFKVSLDDAECAQLNEYFDLAADLIEHHRLNGGKTLVHCAAGRSRSASLVIVYLIKYGKQSLRDSFLNVRRCRPVICPNPGFWRQMIEYEKSLNNGKATVEMLPRFRSQVADVCLNQKELNYLKRKLQQKNDCLQEQATV